MAPQQRPDLAFRSVQLRCLDAGRKPLKHASASGFVRVEDGVPCLYTCWHVVTGYDRNNLRLTNALPRRAFLEVFAQDYRQPTESFSIPLYDESEWPKKPLWYQDRAHLPHPDLNAIGLRVPSWRDVVKIPLSSDWQVPESRLVSNPVPAPDMRLVPGDKIHIVGFPYGFGTDDFGPSTPVVLTRFVTATEVGNGRQEFLLDSGGAPGMSGGPVFVERDNDIALLGLYTGVVYADPAAAYDRSVAALGCCVNLSWCWRGSLPLVREPTEAFSSEQSTCSGKRC